MSFQNIPEELKKLDRWVCWRWEDRDGKPSKVPINPISGERAMSDNPSTWGTYWDAIEMTRKGAVQGIGFVFNGDGVVGVDIDHCKNPETGELTEQARDIISTLDSYTEFSQSGEGIHIICYGRLPDKGRRKACVEMYSTGRYFIMTGKVLDDAHMEIEERAEELAIVHEKYINVQKSSKKDKKNTENPEIVHKNSDIVHLDDDALIEKAMAASNGSKFRALFNGDTSMHGKDDSAADIAFCNLLAYWTGRDAAQMDRIFRRSGLMREKWDERRPGGTYGSITIGKAVDDCRTVYTPREKKAERSQPATPQDPPEIDNGFDYLVEHTSKNEKPRIDDTTTDLGRSKIFSAKYKGQLCWCSGMKSWLIWNGKQWQVDRVLNVMQLAKETIEEMILATGKAVANATGEDQLKVAKQKFRETLKAKGERAIKSMVELAKGDLPITVDQLDADPYLLNCQNGIIDLRTGELQPHRPELYMSKIAGANYSLNDKFQKFDQFLIDVTCNDPDLAEYFQQICGMAAIGKVFYEGMCIFYGGGRNGKSTFLNCISKVFGDYSCSINPEMLMNQKDGRQVAGGVSVEGKRFVTAMEIEEGRRLSGVMLKKLASTDMVTERRLYQDERTFAPSHTLIMASNYLPKVSSTDAGTWRRIAVVPFRAKFEGKTEIKDYASVLYHTDRDAVLSWIVQGAVNYIKNGCSIRFPKVVDDATREYRAAEDWLGNFIQECCEVGEFEEAGGNLFEAYKNWCMQNNESYVRRSRDFAASLEQQGYEKRRTMHGSVWRGLRLVDSAQAASLSKYRSDKGKQSSILDDDELDKYTRSRM